MGVWAYLHGISGFDPDVPWKKYKQTLERANKLLYENDYWAVTVTGLEALFSGGIDIAGSDLLRMRARGAVYFWPVQAAEIELTHFGDFEDAFRHALRHHCYDRGATVDGGMLETSFRRARTIARMPGKRATDDKWHERNLRANLRSRETVIVRVQRVRHPALDGSIEIWLQFPNDEGVRCLPRMPNDQARSLGRVSVVFRQVVWRSTTGILHS